MAIVLYTGLYIHQQSNNYLSASKTTLNPSDPNLAYPTPFYPIPPSPSRLSNCLNDANEPSLNKPLTLGRTSCSYLVK